MRHSTDARLSVGAAVGNGCEVRGTPVGGCGSPGGGRNTGNDEPRGGRMSCDGMARPGGGNKHSSRGDEDALVLIASKGLLVKRSSKRKTPSPRAICGTPGNPHGAGNGTCRGDEEALVLGVPFSSKYLCCDFEARCNLCAEGVFIDILTAGEAVAILGGNTEASASGANAGIPMPKDSHARERAMSAQRKRRRARERAQLMSGSLN
mmetsp:Transcript_57753/g.150494  ORF Transcript_57753/g.150494 Transcript_57753/m.150494 type:complete len:207 (+) Transcript_57753:114-734(+)